MTEDSLSRGKALVDEMKRLENVLSICNSSDRQIEISVPIVRISARLGPNISTLVFDHIRSLVENELELAKEEFEKL